MKRIWWLVALLLIVLASLSYSNPSIFLPARQVDETESGDFQSEYEINDSPAPVKKPASNSSAKNDTSKTRTSENLSDVEVLGDSVFLENECLLYPVNKTYALPPGFVPSGLVDVRSYGINTLGNSAYYLKANASNALSELLKEASLSGYSFVVRSAYRSEATQVTTFNYWVGVEQSKGYSYAVSVERASAYSARPGHSEHQLGTTADIVLPKLNNNFTQEMWKTDEVKWLKQNAHRYGYVISYPEGKSHLTGYSAEPWHVRWIGVEHATAVYKQGYLESASNVTSTLYLLSLR